jgi:hypothetical protein
LEWFIDALKSHVFKHLSFAYIFTIHISLSEILSNCI